MSINQKQSQKVKTLQFSGICKSTPIKPLKLIYLHDIIIKNKQEKPCKPIDMEVLSDQNNSVKVAL